MESLRERQMIAKTTTDRCNVATLQLEAHTQIIDKRTALEQNLRQSSQILGKVLFAIFCMSGGSI